ncbi:MAG: DUF1573 domain-containing protein [Candidatus Cryptobacteroides sp.]
MKDILRTILLSVAMMLLFRMEIDAQVQFEGVVEFDRAVYDFGDVQYKGGPLSCSFTLTNISSKPIVVYNVSSSCGCTDVKWTKEPVAPGKKAVISATYSNDEGPYPFDKSLTAYISDVRKPVVLKLRGVCHETMKPLSELYPVRFGSFGMKADHLKCGNLESGGSKSNAVTVANLSDKPLKVGFKDISEGLSLSVKPNPIPASSVATLSFTVSSVDGLWGRNTYGATIITDGRPTSGTLNVEAFTKESFPEMTQAQKNSAPRPMFDASTFQTGKIKAGKKISAEWKFRNTGKESLIIRKVDADCKTLSLSSTTTVAAGGSGTVTAEIDTSGYPSGELLIIVTLTTNSPTRPIVNLFISGWIE